MRANLGNKMSWRRSKVSYIQKSKVQRAFFFNGKKKCKGKL